MMVASLAYFFSRELTPCDRRIRNNFFGGLFHDLPEALTRDIISPVKRSVETMKDAISEIEEQLVAQDIHPLIPESWVSELSYFTRDEFASKIRIDGIVKAHTSEEISARFDDAAFDPLDGVLLKAADELAAFVEADASIRAGVSTSHLQQGWKAIHGKYTAHPRVAGLDFGPLYATFSPV